MNRKYELMPETTEINGTLCRRIRAIRDFGDIAEGDIGGFVESEWNLSHEGDCWIYQDAVACEDSCVSDNASLFGDAGVSGMARIRGSAIVSENAMVSGEAVVEDEAWVWDYASVSGRARLCGEGEAGEAATICDDAVICGFCLVEGNACIEGNSYLDGVVTVTGDARLHDVHIDTRGVKILIDGNFLVAGTGDDDCDVMMRGLRETAESGHFQNEQSE